MAASTAAATLITRPVAAVVYVSEGRNSKLIAALMELARDTAATAPPPAEAAPHGARLVTWFSDEHYNRCSFVIAGSGPSVAHTAVALASSALEQIDLSSHSSSHPRIGVVDHISIAPLADEGGVHLEEAAATALSVGEGLAGMGGVGLPVLLYGAAHPESRTLAQTRRLTSYFTKDGCSGDTAVEPTAIDLGPKEVDPSRGVCCCGAVTLVLNYNIRLATTDKKVAAAAAKAVRTRSGGPPFVEALALEHKSGNYEVACNLLSPAQTPPSLVLEMVRAVAFEAGVEVEEDYTIGFTATEVLQQLRDEGLIR